VTLLLTPAAAAKVLGICEKTLREHVDAGEITYVLVGRGTKRKRRRFAEEDLAAFAERQRRRECPCPSISRRKVPTGIMTSGSAVFDFQALREQLRSRKHDA
jgi:excisionase family DNA binding protein